jgi:hypothetical protein
MARSVSEYRGETPVLFRILRSGGGHRMNQVECCLAPFEIAPEGFSVLKIRLPDLHSGILSPFATLQFRRRADDTTNGVTGIEQTRSEPSADVACGSGNRDTLPIGTFRHRLIQYSYGANLVPLVLAAQYTRISQQTVAANMVAFGK